MNEQYTVQQLWDLLSEFHNFQPPGFAPSVGDFLEWLDYRKVKA